MFCWHGFPATQGMRMIKYIHPSGSGWIARIFILLIAVSPLLSGCKPDKGTVDEKEAIEGDSLNMREGKGEGPIGEGDKGV